MQTPGSGSPFAFGAATFTIEAPEVQSEAQSKNGAIPPPLDRYSLCGEVEEEYVEGLSAAFARGEVEIRFVFQGFDFCWIPTILGHGKNIIVHNDHRTPTLCDP